MKPKHIKMSERVRSPPYGIQIKMSNVSKKKKRSQN